MKKNSIPDFGEDYTFRPYISESTRSLSKVFI